MKQKRKVKSLFPQKKDHAFFVTTLLLILSLMLCIGTAALITSFVGASDDNDIVPYNFSYDGIDNKREVVYGIKFVDPSKMDEVRHNVFIQDKNLYISPNPVVVNPAISGGIDRSVNIVESGVYSHILGGSGNNVSANNVTIIAGINNDIKTEATVLGGKGNSISSNAGKYSVLVGGENNKLQSGNNAYSVIVGGENNTIKSATESFIIGGNNNTIDGGTSIIVGGKGVSLNGKSNIFVYSNKNFTPQSSKAFYLNMDKGVGVNNNAGGDTGLFVGGAVYIGNVDIQNTECNNTNYGVIGSYSGCLVGCTISRGTTKKWEMLDLGSKCKEICEDNSTKCISPTDTASTDEETNNTYIDAQCTNNVDTGNAKICSRDSNFASGYLEFYKNVIFETVLLDSDTPCPEGQENQCIYKCKAGFHLTVRNGKLGCHKDCVLPWDETQKMKHGQEITAYNITGVSCSNTIYVFPFKTELSSAFPGRTSFPRGGTYYYNRVSDGPSPETCENYEHKRSLKCDNGDLKLIDGNGNLLNGNWDEIKKTYKYQSCSLGGYTCDLTVYNLPKQTVSNIEGNENIIWNDNDRGDTPGVRGIYKLCKDYHSQSNNVCNSSSGSDYHYQLVRCKDGYSTGTSTSEPEWKYTCKQDCTLKDMNGENIPYKHNTTVTGYKSGSVACTNSNDKCESASLTCRDGKWYSSGVPTTNYTHNNCEVKGKTCDAVYNVNTGEYNQYNGISNYESCEGYEAEGNGCKSSGIKYKLMGCSSGYHATGTSSTNLTHCIPNAEVRNCTNKWTGSHGEWKRPGGIVQDYPGYLNLRQEDRDLQVNSGQYIAVWTGTWNNGYWTGMYPENACDWDCEGGWHKSGDGKSCVINKCTGDTPSGSGLQTGNTHPNGGSNKEWTYNTGATATGLLACEWSCQSGYHREPGTNRCVVNKCTGGNPSGAGVQTGDTHPTGNENKEWTYNTGATATGLLVCEWSCQSGYHREPGTNKCVINKCTGVNPSGVGVQTGNAQPTGDDDKEWTYKTGATATQLSACEWSCQSEYHREPSTNKCESNQKTVSCLTGGTIPQNSDYIITGVTVTWNNTLNNWDNADPCGWQCKENYIPNETNTECIEQLSCPAGQYLNVAGNCIITPPGTYSPDGDINKYDCPARKHSNAGASSIDDCRVYGDLDLYMLGQNSTVSRFSLMDRNLGATEIYNGNIDNPNTASYGYHYQWGNNYGFLPCDADGCTTFPNGEDVTEDQVEIDSSAVPSKYASNVYVNNKVWMKGCGTFDCSDNVKNIWGGLTNTDIARQGPCPAGYHVPSSSEFADLLTLWGLSKNVVDVCESSADCEITLTEGLDQFEYDLLLPNAGHRVLKEIGSNFAYLHTSDFNSVLFTSTTPLITSLRVRNTLNKISLDGISINGSSSVRCKKNADNNDITIDSDGGIGAVISVVGGKIHSLGTPSKEGKIFQGWYSDSSFDHEVKIGDTAPQNLYAKWTDAYANLKRGEEINGIMKSLVPGNDLSKIKHFQMADSAPSPSVGTGKLSTEGSPREVIAWYDGETETIYYYANATKMYLNPNSASMFKDMSNVQTIDTSKWDTSKVEDMNVMFNGCSSLTELDVSGWDTSKVKYMAYTFGGCSSLTELDVDEWTTSNVESMEKTFQGCSSLTELDVSGWTTSKVKNMGGMFRGCKSLTELDVSRWDANLVTDMSFMFADCKNLTELKINDNWNISLVENMSYMFKNCEKLTELKVDRWITSKVNNLKGVFQGCSSLTELDVRGWDTRFVTDMSYMFDGCKKLTELKINNNWNISLVTDMSFMFRNCEKLIELNLNNWNTIAVKNMSHMFEGCSSLEELDVSGWITNSVENMGGIFERCSSLTELDLTDWDTSNVLDMSVMFYECSNLQTIFASDKFNTYLVSAVGGDSLNRSELFTSDTALRGGKETIYDENHTDIEYARLDCGPDSARPGYFTSKNNDYSSCDLLNIETNLREGSDINQAMQEVTASISNKENIKYFKRSTTDNHGDFDFREIQLEGNPEVYLWYNPTNKTIYYYTDATTIYMNSDSSDMFKNFGNSSNSVHGALETIDLSDFNTSKVTDMSSMFAGCNNLKSINFGSNFNTSLVNDMHSMFEGCSSLTELAVSGWNTSNVKYMQLMFQGCSSLTILDVGGWNTSNVINMGSMFQGCSSLTRLSLNGWNTSLVTNMGSMFQGCSSLTRLDIGGWNTSSVKNMSSMFERCSSLTELDVGGWTTSNVENMNSMFYGCSSLEELDVSGWNTSLVADMQFMFEGCSSLTELAVGEWTTSNVERMDAMFEGCSSLAELDLSSWNTLKVKNMSHMFHSCSSLTELDLTDWDTSLVEDMTYMFYGCSHLKTIYASDEFNTNKVIYNGGGENMFNEDIQLKGGNETPYNAGHIDVEYARLDCGPDSNRPGYFSSKDNDYPSCDLPDIPTYLIEGEYINLAMRNITDGVSKADIKYFKRSKTDNHEESEYGYEEIQILNNGYPEVYLWYDSGTIYYYTDATTIYMNPDSSKMFESFGHPSDSYGHGALETIDLSDFNTSKVTDMSSMFARCDKLKSINLGSNFYTSLVTDMNHMFSNCSSLSLSDNDFRKLDTSKVENMAGMFEGCSNIKHLNLSLYENFRTNNVTNMESMFAGGPELTCNSLLNFNTSKVKNMLQMFAGTQSKSLDLTSFDTSKVTQMSSMFSNSQLITVDLTSFDTNQVVRMDDMFRGSEGLTTIYASENFTIASIDDTNPEDPEYTTYDNCYISDYGWECLLNSMFAGCYNLSTPYSHIPIHYCKSDTMYGRTAYNQALCEGADHAHIGTSDEIDKDNKGYFTIKDNDVGDFCAGAVDNAAYLISGPEINAEMIRLAGGAENIKSFEFYSADIDYYPPLSDPVTISSTRSRRDVIMWYDSPHKTIYYYTTANRIYMNSDSSEMFAGLTALEYIDIEPDNVNNVHWDTSRVEDMSSMFKNCESLTYNAIQEVIDSWDTSSVEDMSSMFEGCSNLDNIPLASWDVSNVENMSAMFKDCISLGNDFIEVLGNWGEKTSKVVNMSSMFAGCEAQGLYIVDALNSWDTSSVEDMSYMFYNVNGLDDVDALNNWDTSSVKDMSHMFEYCENLSTVHLEWNTSNVENMNSMFRGCDLGEIVTKETPDYGNYVILSGWDTSKVKDMSNMFSLNNSIEYVELNGWDTSSVENMSSMFEGCEYLKTLEISNWDTSSVEYMSNMFKDCGNLTTITASEYFKTDNVTESDDMFNGDVQIKGGNGTTYNHNHINKEYARIDLENQPGYFTYGLPNPIDGVCGTQRYTCESGKPINNFPHVYNYIGGEDASFPGYKWSCQGRLGGVSNFCITCDDDYFRDGEQCVYKPRVYTCKARNRTLTDVNVVDYCTIKNEGNTLMCVNEDNLDCSDTSPTAVCCYWRANAFYGAYPGTEDLKEYNGQRLEYRSLYDYRAPVIDGTETESIIPIQYGIGGWNYGNKPYDEIGYRQNRG